MSVKITGMEMPKSCSECKLTTPCASYCFCKAKGQRVEMGYDKHRMSWCPFCGSKEVYPQTFTIGAHSNNWLWSVKCTEQGCFAEGPICDNEQQAIDAWNKRS